MKDKIIYRNRLPSETIRLPKGRLPKGCYCHECRYAEPGVEEDGEPFYRCHFYSDETLHMGQDDFCSVGEEGEYMDIVYKLESDADGFIGLYWTENGAKARIKWDYRYFLKEHPGNKYTFEEFQNTVRYYISEVEIFD